MADPGPTQLIIEGLSGKHDRRGFSCGVASLDEFLRKYALQAQKKNLSRTYVLAHPGSQRIVGYYTLAVQLVEYDHFPLEAVKRLPQYPVPSVHLARLAVDREFQRQRKYGPLLLADALRQAVATSDRVGIPVMDVHAISERAKRFYLHFGFQELRDHAQHLFITIGDVRASLAASAAG